MLSIKAVCDELFLRKFTHSDLSFKQNTGYVGPMQAKMKYAQQHSM